MTRKNRFVRQWRGQVLLLFSAMVLLFACAREDETSGKFGGEIPISFYASAGNYSPGTKSSAPEFSIEESSAQDTTFEIEWDWNLPIEDDNKLSDSLSISSDTRFSGQVFEVTTGAWFERLDWLIGDKLTIAELQSRTFCEYEVASAPTNDESISSTSLSKSSSTPLVWHAGSDHRFMALYPSVTSMGLDASSSLSLSGTSANISGTLDIIPSTQYNYRVGSRKYKGVHTTSTTGDSETWYEPDMRYAYMTASKEVLSSSPEFGNGISLGFSPCFNSVEVKLRKPDAYKWTTVQLESAILRAGKGSGANIDPLEVTLSGGEASLTISPSAGFSFGTGSGSTKGNEIALYFRNNKNDTQNRYPALSHNVPLSFTFLTLPVDISQLELQLNLLVGSKREPRSATLKIQKDNNWIPLSKGKKLTLSNLKTGGLDTLFVAPDTIHVYANGEMVAGSAPFTITSYTENANGTKTLRPVTATFSTSEDGPWYADNASNMPSDLGALIYADTDKRLIITSPYNTKTGEYLNRMLFVRDNSGGRIFMSDDRSVRANLLRSRPVNGYTEDNPQNLALMDPITEVMRVPGSSRHVMQTANCYIIQRGGWYMLPCVYGDAVDVDEGSGSATNQAAYWPSSYRNYNNKQIGALIYNELFEPELSDFLNTHEVVIVWQDVPMEGQFLTIPDGSLEVTAPGHGLFKDDNFWIAGRFGQPCIRFRIDETKIREGNVLIALREKAAHNSRQRIVWSWHIWVTAENLSVEQLNYYPQESRTESNKLLSVPLGWCRNSTYRYAERKFYVKLKQNTTNKELIIPVVQHQNEAINGDAPYYHWGRKDPLLPGWMGYGTTTGVNKGWSSPAGYVLETTTSDPALVSGGSGFSGSIQNPYKTGSVSTIHYLWDTNRDGRVLKKDTLPGTNGSSLYGNDYNDSRKMKSIYDPCPPGFCVPPSGFGFGAKLCKYNANPSNREDMWNIIWEKGSDLFGHGGVYIRRYPGDTEGFYFPALGTRNPGRVVRNNLNYAYWTNAMDQVAITDEDGNITGYNYYGVLFSFGNTADRNTTSYLRTMSNASMTIAAPIIPYRKEYR